MRVFICADMEGVAGVVSRRQTDDYDSPDYARACALFQEDVLCAVTAAFSVGAEEVVVADSHGPATNLDPAAFPGRVRLVQGWPRPLNMMQGIDAGSYRGAVLLGHHGAITSIDGGFPHSFSSSRYAAVLINGSPVSEGQVNAWLAGHFNVPIVAATGDDTCMASLGALLPGLPVAVTKESHGMYSATQLPRDAALARIDHVVRAGLDGAAESRPLRLEGSVELELRLRNRYAAELISYLPGFERRAAYAVAIEVADITEAVKVIGALVHIDVDCF